LLGYLGETALYNAINFNWGMNVNATCGPIQSTSYLTKVSEFLCPSDPNAGVTNLKPTLGPTARTLPLATQSSARPTVIIPEASTC
jgi:hypothetical protein